MIEISWLFIFVGAIGIGVGAYACSDGSREGNQIATILIIAGAIFFAVGSLCLAKYFNDNYRNGNNKRKCQKCNNLVRLNIKYCPYCGNKLK